MTDFDNPSNDTLMTLAAWAVHGVVSPSMREVRIEYKKEKNTLDILFFFDQPPTEDEIEEASCAITELIAQTGSVLFEFQTIHIPYPDPIVADGLCIYRRYEPNPNPEPMTWETLMKAAVRAMLGRIHPSIRRISLSRSEKVGTVQIFVYFNTAPTIRETRDVDVIISLMSEHFASDISWEKESIVLPFPAKFSKGEMCLYARSEPYDWNGNPIVD
jgi:hypothetical protein